MPQIALHHIAHVAGELHDPRIIQPHGLTRRLIGFDAGAVPHDRKHRINGHHATDHKGDRQQPQKGDRHGQNKPQRRPNALRQLAGWSLGHGLRQGHHLSRFGQA